MYMYVNVYTLCIDLLYAYATCKKLYGSLVFNKINFIIILYVYCALKSYDDTEARVFT